LDVPGFRREGVGVEGVMLAAFLAGLRHGFDIDHVVAIGDITSSQLTRRRRLALATLYAAGHAVVLFVLGALAASLGSRVPGSLNAVMGRAIGATLIVLGLYVLYSLVRFRAVVRMRSRAVLLLLALRRVVAWLKRTPPQTVLIEHTHEHAAAGHHHRSGTEEERPQRGALLTRTHAHRHVHLVEAPSDPFADYGPGTAAIVGMIHGVGAETPTQILLFATTAGVAGTSWALAIVACFVVGLFLGNTVLAVAAAAGFDVTERVPALYLVLVALAAFVSLAVGVAYVADRPEFLPALLGG